MAASQKVIFNYSPRKFHSAGFNLEIPITIPFFDTIDEFVQRLIQIFKIPQSLENDLLYQLRDFIEFNTIKHHNQKIDNLFNEPFDISESAKIWETTFRENTMTYSEHFGQTDEEVFAIAYHKLVHSVALKEILQTEYFYAEGVRDCVLSQDEQIKELTNRQMAEMNNAVENLDITTSEEKINDLVVRHYEDHSLLQAKWSSELNTIKEVQRREFRNWIMEMLEQQASVVTPLSSPRMSFAFSALTSERNIPKLLKQEEIPMEESFTIHLGSQMKQMYNIRLLAADVNDFCNIGAVDNFESQTTPQRLQTAISLYSNDLCGIVLLTDQSLEFSNVTKEFMNICQQSTEFHFSHMEDQMEDIGECVKNIQSFKDRVSQLNQIDTDVVIDWQTAVKWSLHTGDVFITRHSNLAKVHVVFHLIVDNLTLRSNDINSRHPVILGLRNILKMACSSNITTLTIPLLLQHEMSEEMTVQWCTKRAELIFKCVKGFMIEMATWGGSELKNLQFLIPKDISHSVFSSLSTMLPSIFKLSNPVVFKAINQKHS